MTYGVDVYKKEQLPIKTCSMKPFKTTKTLFLYLEHRAFISLRQYKFPSCFKTKGYSMFLLDWTLVFLIVAVIAGVLGFGGLASESAGIAKILFFVFLVIWLITFFMGRV